MSLRELWNELIAARRRQHRQHEREVLQAYRVASFSYPRELPSMPTLRRLLGSGRAQTPAEQRGVMQQIAAVYGLQMEFRPKG